MAKRTVRTKPPASSPVATAGAGCRADSTTHDLASWAYGNGDGMNAPPTHDPSFRGHAIARQPAGQAHAPVIGLQQMRDFVAADRQLAKGKGKR